jgi:hypothetical protein
MLGKKFSLGSVVEETGEARIKLANFDELREQGSDIASFISTFKPDPGYVLLWVLASIMAVTSMATISLKKTLLNAIILL